MTMLPLRPHQIVSKQFLKARQYACLNDAQRVGKTWPAIDAAVELGIKKMCIVTPLSAMHVWERDMRVRAPHLRIKILDPDADVCILPWSRLSRQDAYVARCLKKTWELLILDESHYAKAFSSKRTVRAFGLMMPNGQVDKRFGLAGSAMRVWCLPGPPLPHDPSDIFPTLATLFPNVLVKHGPYPDVRTQEAFIKRYTTSHLMPVGRFKRQYRRVIDGGANGAELRARIQHTFLRRRETDVNLTVPDRNHLLLDAKAADLRDINAGLDLDKIRALANAGKLAMAEEMLATKRRLIGIVKAPLIAAAMVDYFESSEPYEKLVIGFWHTEAGRILRNAAATYDGAFIDGSVSQPRRVLELDRFRTDSKCRVLIGQIETIAEGIDLSVSRELWIGELTFSPRQMSQITSRIANINAPGARLVRTVSLADSVDEIIATALHRLVAGINAVMEA